MKRCRYSACRQRFEPKYRTTEVCCSIEHARLYALERPKRSREEDSLRIANAEKRLRKEALKKHSDWVREAQAVCNAWIRERDFAQPCISCGAFVPDGYWDAGHYRSVGAAPELRFEPLNIHKQCKSCNGTRIHKRGYTQPFERQETVRNRYRANLIERIGLQQVEWLESYHEPLKPSVEWLREKMRWWRADTRRMREARGKRLVA